MSSIRDWFDDFELEARHQGNTEKMRLGELHREAYHFRESDPDRALKLYGEGRRLAGALCEPWWMLYYDQQTVHALLHFKQDYRKVLERAVANVLEACKPGYAAFPRRLLIHGDLVSAYQGIDPAGYADAIRQALDYLEDNTPAEGNERYMLLGSRRQFALDRDHLDEADAFSRRTLALAADDEDPQRAEHFLVFTYATMAEIAWKRGDLAALEEAAVFGEEMAREVGHQVELSCFLMWQAFLARRDGDEPRAGDLHRQASARIARLRMPPDSAYRDAECAFHEQVGRLDLALAARDAELAGLRDRGRVFLESAAHVKRCDLLRRLGRLKPADLHAARESARSLRVPAPVLEILARIEHAGSSTGETQVPRETP